MHFFYFMQFLWFYVEKLGQVYKYLQLYIKCNVDIHKYLYVYLEDAKDMTGFV